MNVFKLVLLSVMVFSTSLSSADDVLTGATEFGSEFKISKTEWPVQFRCRSLDGPESGKFMFSIRKQLSAPAGIENAWLIFPDLAGYSGELYRNGLDWRFDWTDRRTKSSFSIRITQPGEGYYYDWSLAELDGLLKPSLIASCK